MKLSELESIKASIKRMKDSGINEDSKVMKEARVKLAQAFNRDKKRKDNYDK